MKTIVHIQQNRLRSNRKLGTNLPVIIVRTYKGVKYAHRIKIKGPSELIYGQKPLDCGASCYLQTTAEVEIIE